MNYKTLFCFIAQCLSPEEQTDFRDKVLSAFKSGRINKDEFIYTCSNHLMLPAVWLIFEKYSLTRIFPEEYREHLSQLTQKNRERNEQILKQVKEINYILAEQNITPVYLKGVAHLLDGLYSDIGERMIGDIDVLVQNNDYLKAAELIMNLGYKFDYKIYDDVTALKDFPRLFRTDVPADIEIHRVPVNLEHSLQFTADVIYSDITKIHRMKNCYVPSNEHKVIHNFIHSQLSNSGHLYKNIDLRNLYDLYLLAPKVNLAELLNHIEKKTKAEVYFSLADRIFNMKGKLFDYETPKIKAYHKRIDWFLAHPKFHRYYITFIRISKLVFVTYLKRIITAMFNKSSRKYVLNRLKDPQWYKIHINSYKKRNRF